MSISFIQIALAVAGILVVRILYRSLRPQRRRPPGPPGLPLVGNVLDLPRKNASLVYQQWSKKYDSDVVRLDILGTDIVVVNTIEAANELFDKRAAIYSDRHHLTMLNDLVGYNWTLPMTHYGEMFKDMRKAASIGFSPESVKRFRDVEIKAAQELAEKLIQDPAKYMDHARHLAGRLIVRSAYGIDVKKHGDRYLEMAGNALPALSVGSKPGSFLVDTLPFLKYLPEWFPGADFQRQAKFWKPWVEKMRIIPFDEVKEHKMNDELQDCIATTLLERLEQSDAGEEKPYLESVIRATLGSMWGGGSVTHIASISSFILAMMLHPRVQEKARKEIDSVIGTERLPVFSDRPSLPYVDAIAKEILRWRPIATTAIPHRSTEDDVYNGYFIPKGTLVIGNCQAMLHDERVYSDPTTFNPDRFLLDGKLNPDVRDPGLVAYGFGRRICPGRHLAKDSVWMAIVTMLATLDIKPPVDKAGRPVMPSDEYEDGLASWPKLFQVDIRSRSAEHEALILAGSGAA